MDEKEQVIVATDVSHNATDHAELRPLVEQVEQNLGALSQEGSADAGYSSYDNLEFAEGKELKRWAEQKREGKPSLLLYRGESCRGGADSESRWPVILPPAEKVFRQPVRK